MSEGEKDRRKRWAKFAAIAGALLGAVCPFLSPDYVAPCEAAAKLFFLGGC